MANCSCHEEHEESKLPIIIRLIVSLLLLVLAYFNPFSQIPSLYIYIVSYLVISYDIIIKAFKNLFTGHPFDEHFLMMVASICGFFIEGYAESVLVMLLYQFGELLQDVAVDNSHKSIENLLNLKIDKAHLLKDGEVSDIEADDIEVDDLLLVKAGERIPVNGVITEGSTILDMSALTGESLPQNKDQGDEVLSGSINLTTTITIKALKKSQESTASQILNCIEESDMNKADSEKFMTKFAKIYTPTVILLAILLAVIPLIFGGEFKQWLYRACIFLVISCPCALVISIPLSFFIGIGSSARKGAVFKGANHLEKLAKVQTMIFDKTGTLTKGTLKVLEYSNQETLKLAAIAEKNSNHPIAKAIVEAYQGIVESASNYYEEAGKGMSAKYKDKEIRVGKIDFVKNGIEIDKTGTICHVSYGDDYYGYIVIADQIKEDAKEAIARFKTQNIQTVMLSGDNSKIANSIGQDLNIDAVKADLLPLEKVQSIEEYKKTGVVGFVGDGINDAPGLIKSDIGIAMGKVGSEAAIESGDVIIMNDKISTIVSAHKIAKKTLRILKQNIFFILLIKIASMVLGAFGVLPMWGAVIADVGVCILAILSSLRIRVD